MKSRKLALPVFIAASIFAIVAATGYAAPPTVDANHFPPGPAIHIRIPSVAALIKLTSQGAFGKLAEHSELRTAFERISAILGEELSAVDKTLSKMRADVSCADIGGILRGPFTAAVYPGEPGARYPRFMALIGLGNRSRTIRTALGRIAAYVGESEIPEVRVKAAPINRIPCHKWSFREPAISIYTAYFADSLAVANDVELIRTLAGGRSGKRNPALARLRATARADKADAVVSISTARLDLLLENLPVGGGVMQQVHELLGGVGAKRIVWTVAGKPGGIRERIAIEGGKLPQSGGTFQTEALNPVPANADAILVFSPDNGNLLERFIGMAGSALPAINIPARVGDFADKTEFNPVSFFARFAAGPIAAYASFNAANEIPGFALVALTEKPAEAETSLAESARHAAKKIRVRTLDVGDGKAFSFEDALWEPLAPAAAVIRNRIIFASSAAVLQRTANVIDNTSCLARGPVLAAVGQAPLDARVFAAVNLDSLAAYGSRMLRRRLGGKTPTSLPAPESFSNTLGWMTATAAPLREGALVEVKSSLAPGTLLVAAAAYAVRGFSRELREWRIRSNEAAALSALRSILVAQELYRSRYGKFSGDLSVLARERYIEDYLASGLSYGYLFRLLPDKDGKSFTVRAEPVRAGWSGHRSFVLDETGRIRER